MTPLFITLQLLPKPAAATTVTVTEPGTAPAEGKGHADQSTETDDPEVGLRPGGDDDDDIPDYVRNVNVSNALIAEIKKQ